MVIVGEFNSGKSAFINALLGARVLKEGVTPDHGAGQPAAVRAPKPRGTSAARTSTSSAPLSTSSARSHIVDTPGTNAVIREHEAITAEFVPRSDLVLFVTSADRPFTESERHFSSASRSGARRS